MSLWGKRVNRLEGLLGSLKCQHEFVVVLRRPDWWPGEGVFLMRTCKDCGISLLEEGGKQTTEDEPNV